MARDAIRDHLRLLLEWTGAINLTAIRDPLQAVTLHVLDSLTAVDTIRVTGADRLLDLGSGGGYPGLPLAVATPARALLVDSVGKKAAFLRTAVAALGLEPTVGVGDTRAEALARDRDHRERWALVTARAVAALPELVELAFPLLVPGGRLVAWKRGDIGEELARARWAAESLGGATIAVEPVGLPGLSGHVLVVLDKQRPTPTAYPRDPAVRARRPW
ncbi:MAG TPA: 16S rRNA (guanine(527)-N(7))-methyltransferase RsmG [Candidatus Dormibacteraeota bacterium]|nr:16S rRNA (guanine(527)-N(7))-methyltransferase RsmG [Candidatus Dormibacteraeota bacterium]